jgi:lactate racemase
MDQESTFTLELPYGKEKIEFKIPKSNLVGVFSPQPIPAVNDPVDEISNALSNPLGSLPIHGFIKPGKKVVILIDDHTRTTPASLILPHLLDQLHNAGIHKDHMTIMVTHGTHRLSTDEEVLEKVGKSVYAGYRIEQHICSDESNQTFLGLTSRGTPVWINKLVVQSDYRIGIGHIGPSPYAGYSGGYKLIVPGVASLDTINSNHSLVPLGLGKHGNTELPCRLDLEEAAKMIGMDMVIDVVLSQEEKILKVFAGKPESVFTEGLKLARDVYEVDFPNQVDIVVSSATPYDLDLYQAIRAIEYADAVVKPGGSILLLAACPDGIGGNDFYQLVADQQKQPEDFLRDVTRRTGMVTFSVLGHALASIKDDKQIHIISDGISSADLREMGFNTPDSLQSGLDMLIDQYGQHSKIAVFPIGATTIPIVK